MVIQNPIFITKMIFFMLSKTLYEEHFSNIGTKQTLNILSWFALFSNIFKEKKDSLNIFSNK